MPINSINSHDSIKYFLACEQYAKTNKVLMYYEIIYNLSRDARYKTKQFNEAKLNRAIVNYNKVIDLLEKNYQSIYSDKCFVNLLNNFSAYFRL